MFENLDINQQIALISAGAALLGSLIGAITSLAAVWLTKKAQASGKISLFAKIVYSKNPTHKSWGYYKSSDRSGLFMQVSLWLDVINTSGISRIVRNMNLYAYAKKSEVASFVQIQRIGDGESLILMGDNESYTLVIPANSARRFNLEFILHEDEISVEKKEFDEIIVVYFDEKDKIHAFHLIDIDRCWVEGSLPLKKGWITLNKKCKYAK